MSLIERNSDPQLAVTGDYRGVVTAVEALLADQLRAERERFKGDAIEQSVDRDACALAMGDFHDWAALYALPTTAHTMCAYLIELHCVCGAAFEELQDVARAFLVEHSWCVRVPISAALEFCKTAPRAVEARAALH
jgi:hypothetical protein